MVMSEDHKSSDTLFQISFMYCCSLYFLKCRRVKILNFLCVCMLEHEGRKKVERKLRGEGEEEVLGTFIVFEMSNFTSQSSISSRDLSLRADSF